MMTIHCADSKIILTDKADNFSQQANTLIVKEATVKQVKRFYKLLKEKRLEGVKQFVFENKEIEKFEQKVKESFQILKAAGGVVHKNGQVLFIYRLKKWDLPKGKAEAGEDIAVTAIREVEEECGVKASISAPLGSTWHTYVAREEDVMKETVWYEMACLDDSKMQPQASEDIEDVRWLSLQEIENVAFQNTYNAVKEVFAKFKKRNNLK